MEIGQIEQRGGKLFGFEMKWGAAAAKPPKEWLEACPNATWQLINRRNYPDLITWQGRPHAVAPFWSPYARRPAV